MRGTKEVGFPEGEPYRGTQIEASSKKLLRNANADRDVVAAFLAVSDASVGADFNLAINSGVLIDHKGHGLWRSLGHLLAWIVGAGSNGQGEGALLNRGDPARDGLRLDL